MRAAVIERPGSPEDSLRIVELRDPEPGPGEVVVRVKYCGLNHLDLWQRRGSRLFVTDYPRIPGSDAVGVVEALGTGVDGVRPGDYVVVAPGWGDGTCTRCLMGRESECERYTVLGYSIPGCYAEKIVVPARSVYRIPEERTNEQDLVEMAAIPLTFTTAFSGLVSRARVSPGERVFIWSASGGVGVASIKIAKLFGAYVVAHTRSREKTGILRELGADMVVAGDYDEIDLGGLGRFDIVVDYIGARTFTKSIDLLERGGRLVFFGVTSGHETVINLRSLYTKRVTVYTVYIGSRWEFRKVVDLYLRGLYRPYIHRVLPLERVAEAHRILEEASVVGKVLLRHY